MSQFLEAKMYGNPLGLIEWNSTMNRGFFQFDPHFIDAEQNISPLLYPLESLKSINNISFFDLHSIPGFFLDCLPGSFSRRLLTYALIDTGKKPEFLSPLSAFSLLGSRCTGAYNFYPEGYPEIDEVTSVDIDVIVRSLNVLFDKGKNSLKENKFKDILRCGLSTTSEMPAFLIAVNDFNGDVISGQGEVPEGYNSWILKPDGILSTAYSLKTEYEYYLKAVECGLNMVSYRTIREGHNSHLLMGRIDRKGSDKIHYQSLNSLVGDAEKSYEGVFAVMRKLRLFYPEMLEMYKRMVFNILIGNKRENYNTIKFIYTKEDGWHLAPASELYPTPYLKIHNLTLLNKATEIYADELVLFGEQQGIKKPQKIVQSIKDILANFQDSFIT
jgi:serine/threonine-protein kinase HipA